MFVSSLLGGGAGFGDAAEAYEGLVAFASVDADVEVDVVASISASAML